MPLTPARKVSGGIVLLIISTVFVASVFEKIRPAVLSATNRAYADEIITLKPDRLQQKISDLKGEVLDTLAKCESGGRDNESGIIVWDTNNKPSLGKYQFQIATVQHYHLKRTGERLSGRDAILLALDEARARDLAQWVIFDNGKGVRNDWVNCDKWHGLDQKVEVIRSLEN